MNFPIGFVGYEGVTPLKINGWNPQMEVGLEDDFLIQLGDF